MVDVDGARFKMETNLTSIITLGPANSTLAIGYTIQISWSPTVHFIAMIMNKPFALINRHGN